MRPSGPNTPGQPPSLPKPGELNSPYTLVGNEVIEDATAWQLWWEFNKDPYLRLNTINTANRATMGSDFFLGVGEKQIQRGGRASSQTVQTKVVPALKKAIELGGSNEFVQGAMVAISKIGGDDNLFAFEYLLKYFLSNGQPIIKPRGRP